MQKELREGCEIFLKSLKTTFVVLSFMALEIMKNDFAKNKISGPFRPRGEGGQDEMVQHCYLASFDFSLFEVYIHLLICIETVSTLGAPMKLIICI